MGLLSNHESVVWHEFQTGLSTGTIAEAHAAEDWTPAYVSRVLNRARAKIAGALKEQANSHRLDVESLLDYKGLLIGFDYQANAQVYAIYTERLGVVIWYRHDSYAGKLCPECPKEEECREALELPMTQRSIAIFNKLAAKETPRYKRREESD